MPLLLSECTSNLDIYLFCFFQNLNDWEIDSVYSRHAFAIRVADDFFLAVFTTEFLMKIYADSSGYWSDGYNVSDFIVLVFSMIPIFAPRSNNHTFEFMKLLRTLRTLKVISYVKDLQVLTKALLKTLQNSLYIFLILAVAVFIFAVLGHHYYGNPVTGDVKYWGRLEVALLTVLNLLTLDNWTTTHASLENHGFTTGTAFILTFIICGYFVFFNVFIGVVIMTIQQTGQKFHKSAWVKRIKNLLEKIKVLKKHQKDDQQQIKKQESIDYFNFSEKMAEIKKTLQPDDYVIVNDWCCSMLFIDVYLASLDCQDKTLKRLFQMYSEISPILSALSEDISNTTQLSGQVSPPADHTT
ncbi:cation channel sperm-associated protein 3 [Protopterus annectens]|uniref:cation channel sperm-associated protein 3 n=1 Tax=Protopterus annectens TaxID=7888 RepID=UPI001CF970DA|nr:cation channel sperm-associated protein 3 [Protopterus annectens]